MSDTQVSFVCVAWFLAANNILQEFIQEFEEVYKKLDYLEAQLCMQPEAEKAENLKGSGMVHWESSDGIHTSCNLRIGCHLAK